MHPATGDGGQRLTVHQLLRHLAPEYLQHYGSSMPGRHREVLKKILSCRTPALGGQLFQCSDCSSFAYRYHSCNDRHCPQCGQTDADDWLQRQKSRLLLPVPYFLLTFTVPEPLRMFIRLHMQIGLDLLFDVTSQALQELAANPRRLGAQLGMLGVLHTWSRTLIFHPHIHYLVPGGGLSLDQRRWVPARNNFLLHHKTLGAHVRTLFKERLSKEHPALFDQVPAKVWKPPWNVGCQAAGSGENALRYLSRYVFKTATSNRQVSLLPEGKLMWPYRDSRTGQWTSVTLEPLAWIRRFVQHILPAGFARVRTFGWLHPAAKVRANRVRALLRQKPVLSPAEQQAWQPPAQDTQDKQRNDAAAAETPPACAPLCPRCQKAMQWVGRWFAGTTLLHPKRPP